MFDFGFFELLLIGVVGLIVVGPQRLPKVARTIGEFYGRMQRYVTAVKADIQREVELDELRKLRDEVEASARSIEESVNEGLREAQTGLREAESGLREIEDSIRETEAAAREALEPPTDADPALAPAGAQIAPRAEPEPADRWATHAEAPVFVDPSDAVAGPAAASSDAPGAEAGVRAARPQAGL